VSLAQYFLENKAASWLLVVLLVGIGSLSFERLGRLEDPEYTIKDAMIFTSYPGATPREVEQEVTDRLESAIQQLPQVKRITSTSKPGQSEIKVSIKDKYDKHSLPQVWDELRRKINDTRAKLPPGTNAPVVNDDFGDVFGLLYAITGDGFTNHELHDFAKTLRKELLLLPGVAKVNISGIQQEVIYVEMSRSRLSQMGLSPQAIFTTLENQNLVKPSGKIKVDGETVRILPTGDLDSVRAIENLLITSSQSKKTVYLKDIANVVRTYEEIPSHLIRFQGEEALTIGLSLVSGGNVVALGEIVTAKLKEIEKITPIGIQVTPVYEQPKIVEQSIDGFMMSLLQALAIVIIVLLFFMGMRSGLIIGAVLLLTVLGTFIFMDIFSINLQRISLGALIIALGMLVDNAIVVTDGILVHMQNGEKGPAASMAVVKQTMMPLLGATIVGILAFSGIGLSQDSTGEYVGSLFQVILISLLLSWILAITLTPVFCCMFLQTNTPTETDHPQTGFLGYYCAVLKWTIQHRILTIAALFGLLGASIFGFNFLKPGFFPDSTTPIFYLDYWRAEGTDIRETSKDLAELEKYIMNIEGVKKVTSFIGQGGSRFMLVYGPVQPNSSYGQLVIEVDDYTKIPDYERMVLDYVAEHFPNSEPKAKRVRLGPGKDAKIEARFSSTDPQQLRIFSEQVKDLMQKDGRLINIRDDWRQKTKILRPLFSEQLAGTAGLSRADLKDTLELSFSGTQVGLYREGDMLIPIKARNNMDERHNIDSINDIMVWSETFNKYVPIQQIVTGFDVVWQDNRIKRRNRKLTITTSSDPAFEPAGFAFNRIRPLIEKIPLPSDVTLEWGGEYEDSRDAQAGLSTKLPMSFLLMFVIVFFLFGKAKQPLIIWLTVPLAIIGVTIGLLATNKPFDFMALLGFLSLTGMLIKNAIVLIDQIDLEIASGKEAFKAVIESSASRVRPVSMAAITTVLGMLPLIPDAFFTNMAVLIMSGLSFATLLTLFVIPILYTIFFKIRATNESHYS